MYFFFFFFTRCASYEVWAVLTFCRCFMNIFIFLAALSPCHIGCSSFHDAVSGYQTLPDRLAKHEAQNREAALALRLKQWVKSVLKDELAALCTVKLKPCTILVRACISHSAKQRKNKDVDINTLKQDVGYFSHSALNKFKAALVLKEHTKKKAHNLTTYIRNPCLPRKLPSLYPSRESVGLAVLAEHCRRATSLSLQLCWGLDMLGTPECRATGVPTATKSDWSIWKTNISYRVPMLFHTMIDSLPDINTLTS